MLWVPVGAFVNCLRPVPSVRTIQTLPSALKGIQRPSGDQLDCSSLLAVKVSRVRRASEPSGVGDVAVRPHSPAGPRWVSEMRPLAPARTLRRLPGARPARR